MMYYLISQTKHPKDNLINHNDLSRIKLPKNNLLPILHSRSKSFQYQQGSLLVPLDCSQYSTGML